MIFRRRVHRALMSPSFSGLAQAVLNNTVAISMLEIVTADLTNNKLPALVASTQAFDIFDSDVKPGLVNSKQTFDTFASGAQPGLEASKIAFDTFDSDAKPGLLSSKHAFDDFAANVQPGLVSKYAEIDGLQTQINTLDSDTNGWYTLDRLWTPWMLTISFWRAELAQAVSSHTEGIQTLQSHGTAGALTGSLLESH